MAGKGAELAAYWQTVYCRFVFQEFAILLCSNLGTSFLLGTPGDDPILDEAATLLKGVVVFASYLSLVQIFFLKGLMWRALRPGHIKPFRKNDQSINLKCSVTYCKQGDRT